MEGFKTRDFHFDIAPASWLRIRWYRKEILFFKQVTYMVTSSRLRPRSAPAFACGSTDTALPPADVISSPCIPTPSSHMDCSNVGSTSRQGWGPTKGFRSERLRAKTGGKLLVQFKDNVPIGINASDFVSEIGLQVRKVALVRGVRRWKEVPADVRQVIKARVFTKYEVMDYDTSDDVRVAVDRKFQARYRDWCSWMHTHYKNCLKKEIDTKTIPFSSVDKDDWVWVIENVYEDEKFHERSMKNTESRKRLPYNHCTGFKSFKATMHALADPETGEEPRIVEFYRESHYNKKKDKWMDQNVRKYIKTCSRAGEVYVGGCDPIGSGANINQCPWWSVRILERVWKRAEAHVYN